MQGGIFFGLQVPGPLLQVSDVLLPCRDGVGLCGAGGFEDRLPQFFLRLLLGEIGENLACPGGSRGGDHAPVDGVAGDLCHDRVDVFGQAPLQCAHPVRIKSTEEVGVCCNDGKHGVPAFDHIHCRLHLPDRELIQ